MQVKFQPAFKQVLIRRDAAREVTKGGIFIADTCKDRPSEGMVLAVGFDVHDFIKPGLHVLFGKYSGIEVNIDEQELLLIEQKDILGKRLE